MGKRESEFLEKNGIDLSKVMYMTKDGRKTVLHMEKGVKIETFYAMKRILDEMPDEKFECINKGVIISPKYVRSVSNNVYFMADGAEFIGRVRVTKQQRKNAKKYNEKLSQQEWKEFSILTEMPLAFCVIELMFDENSHGIDFVFRYCNKEMERLEGKTLEEMLDHSFYDVFENGDKKWLVAYADVALNGGKKVIEGYSPEIQSDIVIYCYQPKPGYCACALIKK